MYDNKHYAVGIAPVADFNDGTKYTDVVSMVKYKKMTFVVFLGAEATGTATWTVEACTTAAAAATQAVAFRYKYDVDAGASSDTFTGMAACASTGFTTTAGAGGIYVIEVNSDDLYFTGGARYEYVRLKAVEVADDPVTGCVLCIGEEPRYGESVQDSMIV
jgi:hypothetical protein